MEAVHSDTSSPLKVFFIPNIVLFLSLLIITLLISVSVSIGVCQYMRRQKSESYYTQEDKGDTHACDADTAVLNARTGPRVERRKEWIL